MSAQVKPGYKLTEVGVIPEDWDVANLGEHANFRTGPFGSALHKSDYTIAGVPIINPMHILDGQITPTLTMTITEQAAQSLAEFRLKFGEVVIGRRGDMGRCAVVQHHQQGWMCGTGSMIVRPGKNFDAEFLQRILSSPKIVAAIEDMSVGSTMINLNQGVLASLKLQLPALVEQRHIASALSDMDAMISGLDQLIAKKRDIKHATMQQLLTSQKRLLGFNGEWKVMRLGALASIKRGASPRPIDSPIWFDNSSDVGWVRISDVTRSSIFLKETKQRLSALGVKHSRPVSRGSLIMSICATVGRPIITDLDTCIHDGFVVFDDLKIEKYFMYYALKFIEGDWSMYGQTGSQMNLNTGLINNTRIPVPPSEEQTAIATILADMDSDLATLEDRRDKAHQLKQGMMQELLTGKIRLS